MMSSFRVFSILLALLIYTGVSDAQSLLRMEPEAVQPDPEVFHDTSEFRASMLPSHASFGIWSFHGNDESLYVELRDALQHATNRLSLWIGPLPEDQNYQIWIIQGEGLWRRLVRANQGIESGISFQKHRTLALFQPDLSDAAQTALYHELVHLYFRWVLDASLPLWAEEGAAQAWAWRLARSYAREERGVRLTRTFEEPSTMIPLKKLMRIRSYPKRENQRVQFYRCAEKLMELLIRKLPDEELPKLWTELTRHPRDLDGILKRQFGWTAPEWDQLEQKYRLQVEIN